MSSRDDKIAARAARRKAYREGKKERSKASSQMQKTAGEVRFVRDEGPQTREIPDNFEFKTNELQELSRILWGLSCSLGHLVSSHTKFTKLKAVNISPDGMFGGKGYIQDITEMRKDLMNSMETISECIDTIHDEIEAPHWKETWGDMSYEEKEDTEEMISESEEIVGEPEEFAEEEFEEELGNEEDENEDEEVPDEPTE